MGTLSKRVQEVAGKYDNTEDCVDVVFASRYGQQPLPKYSIAEDEVSREVAYQTISDHLQMDGKPRLNLASFVTTWMEPEVDKLLSESNNKNLADLDEYPASAELQERCVNILARLFNAPLEGSQHACGTSTIGSSEAIILGGLAMKRRWQKRRQAKGKSIDKPNMIIGSNTHVAVEKFARYFDVETKVINVSSEDFTMDSRDAVEACDENTIGIFAIVGTTYTGHFEDIKGLNDLLEKKNRETGWDVPIHVDGASGQFVAAFAHPELAVDFRLPWVKSINVSGHKYGLCYPGIGWAIWRTTEDLPEDLLFHVNYLGNEQSTFTLNFSKGSGGVVAQYYQFIRLGNKGYRKIMENCIATTRMLKDRIEELKAFEIISSASDVPATPLVAFRLKDTSKFDEFEFAKHLRRHGWIVPAYSLPPIKETGKSPGTALRVVVREDFSRGLADWLVKDMQQILEELNELPSKIAMRAAKQIENMKLGENDTLQIAKDTLVEAHKKEGKLTEAESDGDGRKVTKEGEEESDPHKEKVQKRGHFVSKHNPVC